MRPFRFLAFVPTIIVLVVITYLSLAKNPVHSQEFYLFEGADKLVHGCMYLGLVWIALKLPSSMSAIMINSCISSPCCLT